MKQENNMIPRIYDNLDKYLKKGKVLVIFGPRQVGKTTLVKNFLAKTSLKYRYDTGEDFRIAEIFSSNNPDKISEYASGYELVVIDEAQKVQNIGTGLKLLVDSHPQLMVIATGSSSFDLAGNIGEPLTGRKRTLTMFPLSHLELSQIYNKFELKEKLEDLLIFGAYPEVVTASSKQEKGLILDELAHSYLLKDIIAFDKIKNSRVIFDLLRLLAFQTGSQVSLSEIAKNIGVAGKTVGRYLDLLEKSFVSYSLSGFSRNLRKEIVKKNKYYFYDNGIRNALISNFNPLHIRNDKGQLWENFLFNERLRKNKYCEIFHNLYFWRTWDQKEIDLVEEREGKLFGYEFKFGNKKPKAPALWSKTYPEAEYEVINRENYLDFVGCNQEG
jgi:predicted AAA+ superfamily ATPase